MRTLLGFALGFYLGAKIGPKGLDELAESWQTIKESEEFQALSASAKATVETLIEQGVNGVTQFIAGLTGGHEHSEPEYAEEAGEKNGDLKALWPLIAQAFQSQNLTSIGIGMLIQMLERGLSGSASRA
jgi:hypothetical protein